MWRGLLLAPLAAFSLVSAQAKVIQAEYFFDTDPGIGNGTLIPFDPDDVAFTGFDFTVPMAEIQALSVGTHQLVVRYQDDTPNESLQSLKSFDPGTGVLTYDTESSPDSDWSVAYARTFAILPATPPDAVGAIDYAEYVVTNDDSTAITPLGSGTEITNLGTLASGMRNVSFNVPGAGLTKGDIYSIGVRFRDDLGNWSTTETRRFMLAPVPEVDGMTVTLGEYTISSLDGTVLPASLGNGTMLTLPTVVDGKRAISATVPPATIQGLAPGTYKITFRFQDDQGNWSVPSSRSFGIIQTADVLVSGDTVTAGEYFILPDSGGTPPAFGAGSPIDLGTAVGGDHQIALNIPPATIASLSVGKIYSLTTRFQDNLGQWSVAGTRRFMLAPIPEVDGMVVKGEYTLSATDGSLLPGGLGSGEMLMLPDPVDGSRMLAALISPEDIALLAAGIYKFTVRFQDDQGDWSIPQTRTFTVPDLTDVLGTAEAIVRGEYFILADADNLVMPPLGTGTAFTLPAPVNGEISLNTIIPGSAFPASAKGVYHVGFRFQDDQDNWSVTYARATMIPEPEFTASLAARIRYNIYDPEDNLVEQGEMFGSDSVVNFPSDVEDIVETHNLMVDPDPYKLEMYLLDNEGQPASEIDATFRMVTHRDLWEAIYFTDPLDRADPLISGPLADPNHDGVPNLLAFVLGLDPLLEACTLEFVQLDGQPNLTPLSQIPTVLPPGIDLSLRALNDLPISGDVWAYDTDTDAAPELIDTDNFSLMSPVESIRSDRLNVHAVMSGTRVRHFFDLCADLRGTWPYIYPMAP